MIHWNMVITPEHNPNSRHQHIQVTKPIMATTSHQFGNLPQELQDQVWEHILLADSEAGGRRQWARTFVYFKIKDVSSITVAQLKDRLKLHGLPFRGSKAVLIHRLRNLHHSLVGDNSSMMWLGDYDGFYRNVNRVSINWYAFSDLVEEVVGCPSRGTLQVGKDS